MPQTFRNKTFIGRYSRKIKLASLASEVSWFSKHIKLKEESKQINAESSTIEQQKGLLPNILFLLFIILDRNRGHLKPSTLLHIILIWVFKMNRSHSEQMDLNVELD